MAKQIVVAGSITLFFACGGSKTPPNGEGAGDASTVTTIDATEDAPSALARCDGECTLSFASGADWQAYVPPKR